MIEPVPPEPVPLELEERIRILLTGQVAKTQLLEALAQALHFPDWFGHNWDALWDALDEYLATARQPLKLEFDLGCVQSLDEGDWQMLVEILDEARGAWPERFFYTSSSSGSA